MTTTTPTPENIERYSTLVNSLNKGNVIVNVVSVSRSGLSRKFRFYAANANGRLVWLNACIAELLRKKMDNEGNLPVRGWGMDFAVDILMNCANRLKQLNFNVECNGYQRI